MTTPLHETVLAIQSKAAHFTPEIGLILGSGLGELADQIQDAVSLPYETIPGFPVSTVKGHSGKLVLGYLAGKPVACLQGRVHLYEGASPKGICTLIHTLQKLGCKKLILTNAAGSLRESVPPGALCMISDHINFQPSNPLIGPNDESIGPRFFPLDNAYDVAMREQFQRVAKRLNITLPEGVYLSTIGPGFETPAEIRAFRILGADLVGMSTVPEVLVARHCGLKVAAISAVSNLAAGMSEEELNHENTLIYSQKAASNLLKLIRGFLEDDTH